MASFMDRVRKLLKRKPKKQASKPAENGAHQPQTEQQNHQPAPQQQPQQVAITGDGQDDARAAPGIAATQSGRLQIALRNDTNSSVVYAYITGQAIDSNNALFLLGADGRTPVFPPSPGSTGTKIERNISIRLGAPGNTTTVTIPRIAGGRIWFSIGTPLVFAVNPGPGLVEPSVFNQADPNINANFGKLGRHKGLWRTVKSSCP